jgi:hypothetical protein
MKRVPWAEIAAALMVGLNLVLLGLPGALLVSPVSELFEAFGRKTPGDFAWPAAIWVSMLMPVGFVLTVMRVARLRPGAPAAALILWGLAGTAAAGFAVSLVLIGLMAQ